MKKLIKLSILLIPFLVLFSCKNNNHLNDFEVLKPYIEKYGENYEITNNSIYNAPFYHVSCLTCQWNKYKDDNFLILELEKRRISNRWKIISMTTIETRNGIKYFVRKNFSLRSTYESIIKE